MKIVIKADGCHLCLWFPLSILKSRIGYRAVKSSLDKNTRKYVAEYTQTNSITQDVQDTDLKTSEQGLQVEVVAGIKTQNEQIKQEITKEISFNREQMVEIYNILKRRVKEYGHFNIVEVQSHDGEKVIIRV